MDTEEYMFQANVVFERILVLETRKKNVIRLGKMGKMPILIVLLEVTRCDAIIKSYKNALLLITQMYTNHREATMLQLNRVRIFQTN